MADKNDEWNVKSGIYGSLGISELMNLFGAGGKKYQGLLGSLGLGNILGGGGDDSEYQEASSTFQKYLDQAKQELEAHEAAGRADVTGYMDPYTEAGKQGLQAYMGTLGLEGPAARQSAYEKFQQTPGYQFALQQGQQSIERANAARGLTGSGAESVALQKMGQGLANQEFNQYQSRLQSLAGQGQQAAQFGAGTLAQMGEQYGGTLAQLYGTMGQAQANALMAEAQARAKSSSSLLSSLGAIGGAAAAAFL